MVSNIEASTIDYLTITSLIEIFIAEIESAENADKDDNYSSTHKLIIFRIT